MRRVVTLAIVLACALSANWHPGAQVYASTITVAAGGDIQAAIDGASAGDTINLAAGTYTPPTSGTNITILKNLTIAGATDSSGLPASTISPGNVTRTLLMVNSGVTATMSNVILTGASVSQGNTGVLSNGGTFTLDNVTVTGNSADTAQNIDNAAGATLLLTNSRVTNNQGGSYGGAITMRGGTLNITNSTLSGNAGGWGGAIATQYAGTITITNSTFSGNTAYQGEGTDLFAEGGTITISGSTFQNSNCCNPVVIAGGATASITNSSFSNNNGTALQVGDVYHYVSGAGAQDIGAGRTTVSGSTFTGNHGGDHCGNGAAIDIMQGDATVSTSTFSSNSAGDLTSHQDGDGGAISVGAFTGCSANNAGGTGSLTVTKSTFTGNQAGQEGGAISAVHSTVSVTDSTMSGNTAYNGGGALSGWDEQYGSHNSIRLNRDTLTGNTVTVGQGGAILNYGYSAPSAGSSLTVANSTITANTAASAGGIENESSGTVQVWSSTIANNSNVGISNQYNTATQPGSAGAFAIDNSIVAGNGASDCSGTITATYGYNLIQSPGSGCTPTKYYNSYPNPGTMPGLMTGKNPLLNALADNGGFTQTMSLQGGSSAMDAGYDTDCAAAPTSGIDQRGVARPAHVHCALGAYEGYAPPPATSLKVIAPKSLAPGQSGQVTVNAVDANGNTVPAYTGTVHFTSTDSAASLPGDYTFTSADAGSHTVSVTFNTGGNQTITATDTGNEAISGTSAATRVFDPVSHTTLVSSTNPSTYGSPVTFTATVDPSNAAGTVQFQVDGTNMGSPAPVSGGIATSTTATLGVGNHTITAVYSGDPASGVLASSGTVNQTVGAAASNLTTASWTTPGTYTWTVPNGVNWIAADVRGASGGNGAGQSGGGSGGRGGDARATLHVAPGKVLTVRVGGAGGNAIAAATAGAGGYGGGGNGGGLADIYPAYFGGGGGGASLIATTDPTPMTLLIGAGGGGGSSGLLRQVRINCSPSGLPGGNAGYPAGSQGSGSANQGATGGGGGGGGTQTAGGSGGAAGYGGGTGGNGSLDTGGAGSGSSQSGGGGGGGGYYGGGGGGGSDYGCVGGGGGGGSSHADASITDTKFSTSSQSGNGAVSFSYLNALVATALTVSTASGTYGGATSLSATLTSGGTGVSGKTITFSLNGNAVCGGSSQLICPTTDSNGVATLSGVSLAGMDAGPYPSGVSAAFAGDSGYLASSDSNTLTVNKADQTISVNTGAPSSAAYNATFTVTATGGASSSSVTYGSSGGCTNSGTTYTMTSGTTPCSVTFDQAGDGNYNAAPQVTETVNASTIDQSIIFGLPSGFAKTYGDNSFTMNDYASGGGSGNPITFSSETATVCTASGSTVTITRAGTCTLDANQAGDGNYNPAVPVQQSFPVSQKAVSVVAGTPSDQTYGSTSAPTVSCTASGFVGSDGFVTPSAGGVYDSNGTQGVPIDSNSVAGTYVTKCSGGDAGDNYTVSTYSPGTFTIAPAALTITANNHSYTYGNTPSTLDVGYSTFANGDGSGSLTGTLSCSAYAASDTGYANPMSLTSSTPVVNGGYVIHCSGLTGANYAITWVDGTLTVNPRPLTVTASSPASQTYGATSTPTVACTPSGFVGSDGFTANPTGAVYTTGGTLVTIGSGSSAATYTTGCTGGEAGNNYSVSGVPGSFTIDRAPLTITASSPSMTYGGTVPPITASYSAFANHDSAASLATPPTCGTIATSGSDVGQYASSCALAADSNYAISYAAGSVTVNPAPVGFTLGTLSQTYNGTARSATVSSSPVGVTPSVRYTGESGTSYAASTTPPTNAGSYKVDVTSANANYSGTTTGTLIIAKAASTVTVMSSVNLSIVGQSVTFTATASSAGTRTGTVTFKDGTGAIATRTVNGSGIATYTTSTLAAGTHPITVSYSGDTNVSGSATASLTSVSQQVRYGVKTLSTASLTVVLQLQNSTLANLSASTIPVTAQCVVANSATAPTTCAPNVLAITKAFRFLNSYKGQGAAYSFSINPKGLTKGQTYYLLVQTGSDQILHAVQFTA